MLRGKQAHVICSLSLERNIRTRAARDGTSCMICCNACCMHVDDCDTCVGWSVYILICVILYNKVMVGATFAMVWILSCLVHIAYICCKIAKGRDLELGLGIWQDTQRGQAHESVRIRTRVWALRQSNGASRMQPTTSAYIHTCMPRTLIYIYVFVLHLIFVRLATTAIKS